MEHTRNCNISQKQVWSEIAVPWKKFRSKPVPEAIKFLKTKKGKILDLGCGSGRNFLKKKDIEIYAVDFSENMLKFAEKYAQKEKINAKFFLSDAGKLPFENDFFDAAIYVDSLHCIEKEKARKKSLQELYRVLKQKSQALISVWNKNQPHFRKSKKEIYLAWRENNKRYMRYYYLYEIEELIELLKSFSFKINKILEYSESNYHIIRKIIIIVEK